MNRIKNVANIRRFVGFRSIATGLIALASWNAYAAYAAGPYAVSEATGGAGTLIHVPADIPHADCSVATDVRLNTWLRNQVPNGARVLFPKNGCYGYDKTITLIDRKNLTIDGNGSTFKAVTLGHPTRDGWQLMAGSNIVLKNMTVIGFDKDAGVHSTFPPMIDHDHNPDTPKLNFEWQHAYEVKGTKGALLENIKGFNTYGDFVGVAHDNRHWCDAQCTAEAEDVIIRNSEFANATRQGISITWADGVSLSNNKLTNVNRAGLDFEPYEGWEPIRNINLIGNTFTDIGFSPITVNGPMGKGKIGNYYIVDNIVAPVRVGVGGCLPAVLLVQGVPKGTPKEKAELITIDNVTIQNNDFSTFAAGITLYKTNNVKIMDNRMEANSLGQCVGGAIDANKVNGLVLTGNIVKGFTTGLHRKGPVTKLTAKNNVVIPK